MNKLRFLLGGLVVLASLPMMAQMDASIKLNEVMTKNETSLIDGYGERNAWVEIANISHSTYNIRGMYLTTDRTVLDKKMSVPERVKRMSQIPNGDTRTNLSAQQIIVFQLNSSPAQGALHLSVKVDADKPTWIALYNGNATQLIDSVTVPVLAADQSYARINNNGIGDWEVKSADRVTPGIQNQTVVSESKVAGALTLLLHACVDALAPFPDIPFDKLEVVLIAHDHICLPHGLQHCRSDIFFASRPNACHDNLFHSNCKNTKKMPTLQLSPVIIRYFYLFSVDSSITLEWSVTHT